LFPDVAETVSHVSLLLIVQFVLDVIANDFCSPAAVKTSEAGETDRVGVGDAAACVTLMDCAGTLVPLTVTVAVRWVVAVFAAAVTVIVSSLLPDVAETVSHVSLLLIVQLVVDVIANDFCSPAAIKESADSDKVSVGVAAACVTLTDCAVTPVPLTVTVAVR
jgi:uncharacterized protein involved in cysteine biosynthesis